MNQENLSIQEWHRKQAVDNFNHTWDLIDKTDRTKDDEVNMIHTAHASRFHWGQIGKPLNFARGEWQISRVYALLNMGESALFHGKNSLELCKENSIGDFDLAFAYEAIARAYMVVNDSKEMQNYIDLATEAAENIEEKGNKDYFLSELKTIQL